MKISIKTPSDFNFRRTVLSHGWCALPPFEFDKINWSLVRVLNAGETRPVTVTISGTKGGIEVRTSRRMGRKVAENVVRDVRHMLRLDDDMLPFYRAVSADSDFEWIAHEGAGRLLRSPTVFED